MSSRGADAPVVLQPGRPWPLGASVRDGGVNFAVWSAHAQAVELELFDGAGEGAAGRARLPGRTGEVWHGFLPGATAGTVYGYRAHGPFAPDQGHRFAPHKLLLDPWAREIVGRFEWRPEHFAHDGRDNARFALKARVVGDDGFDWQGDAPLRRDVADTVLYELHVRGFTIGHPGVPAARRGTYAGLASDAAIAHLQRLGVTAVSLLPVHQHLDEQRLVEAGLSNHWGYNTIGYFCPEPRLAAAAAEGGRAVRDEFRAMVRRLHAAGIEVILDVVFNHTAESDETGPTIAWRGLDNRGWYRLAPHAPDRYENLSGCGNTLDIRHAPVLQLVMDSLRHWVQEYHVDGFRFDLAPTLGRGERGFDRDHAFFRALAQDPVLAGTRCIAEPWDLGHGGYRLGDFPPDWLEWNDRFRDALRAFWLGHVTHRGAFAHALAASAHPFRESGKAPAASVNFVVAHDGFTLLDLVSYRHRRNEANREGNRDGHAHNLSTDCGHEGPSGDPEVRQRRAALQRALLACTVWAQGTPMLAAGAELGHTQGGNNNAYCQDNPISWIDWEHADRSLLEFAARAVALRHELQPFGHVWHQGIDAGNGLHDLGWRQPDGRAMTEADWHDPHRRALAVLIGAPGRASGPVLMLVNAEPTPVEFTLPPGRWRMRLASCGEPADPAGATLTLAAHAVALLTAAA
jgi:glycogen operon protein